MVAKAATKKAAPRSIAKDPAFVALKKAQEATDGKIETLAESMSTLIDAVNNSITPSNASSRPVSTNTYLESEEQSLGSTGEARLNVSEGGDVSMDRPDEIETERVVNDEKFREIAFNEQFLEVQIHDTSDKDAQQVFEIEVNGEAEFFRRGERKRVKRKFVEGLARAKPIEYGNEEFQDTDGLKKVRYPTHKGLRFPFALINPKPIDDAWLQSILAQP